MPRAGSTPANVFGILLVLRCLTLQGGAPQQPGATDRVIKLFNGRDLTGLYTWLVDTRRDDPRRVFTVTNGMIHISGDGLGYLATEREYQNYHLIVEFQWGRTNWHWGDRIGKARDSGIFLHAAGPDGNSHDGNGAFMSAIECNLFQGATSDLLLIRGSRPDGSLLAPRITAEVAEQRDPDNWPYWQKSGSRQTIERWGRLNWFAKDRLWQDQLDFRGRDDLEKPAGEWNQVECICDESRITIKVNGTVANEASDVFPSRGRILLQCEGSEIFFRRFELRPLSPRTVPPDIPAAKRVRLTEGQLFVPGGWKAGPGGIDLTLHFHGAPAVVESNFLRAKISGALVNVTLPGLSGVYAERFRDPKTFRQLLEETRVQLQALGAEAEPHFRRVIVTSFSAGFGAVRELLKDEAAFARIDALVMADSIYAGYVGDPGDRRIDSEKMEGFLKFAREAVEGRKWLIISHSAQRPDGYASTTETADYLTVRLGGQREPAAENWPGDLKLQSRARMGRLEIYGFAGDSGGDHMKHLQNLWLFLERVRF